MAVRGDGARDGVWPAVGDSWAIRRRRSLSFLNDGRESARFSASRNRRESPDRTLTGERRGTVGSFTILAIGRRLSR